MMMKKKRILILTSDDLIISKIHFEFDSHNYIIQKLANPLLSIDILVNNDYYAVVADIALKELYTIDMINSINFLHSSMPVILLSDNLAAEDILMSYELGIADICPRDFKHGEIKLIVEKTVSIGLE